MHNFYEKNLNPKNNLEKLLGVDKWGFWYLIGWFVGGTGCTLQTLYAWLMRGFGIVWLESSFIGSYVYHSDVIAGMHTMLLI